MVWKCERGMHARTRSLRPTTARQRLIIGGLVLTFLTLSACQQDTSPQPSQGITPTSKTAQISQSITPTPTKSSIQRNHISAGTSPLFARITFTTSTSYEQAVALLTAAGGSPYP